MTHSAATSTSTSTATATSATQPELLEPIEAFLKSVLPALVPDDPVRGRPRVLPALALWAALLVSVARGFSAQLEVWRLLAQSGLWDFPRFAVKDDAVYKRLKQASAETFVHLFEQLTALVRARLAKTGSPDAGLAPFARGVYALDAMTLDALTKRLPSLRARSGTVLAGKVQALFDLRAQVWQRVVYLASPTQNDKVAAPQLIADLPRGSLLLADLGYFSFAWFDTLTAQGYYWISRLRAKTSYTLVHTFYARDGVEDALVWLGAHRADRAAHAVRLVRFTHQGKTWAYLTNVLQPRDLPLAEIARLYARRWDIEMMFNLVKTHLRLHLIWSGHLNVVVHQVLAVFCVAQIILGLRTEIAARAQAQVGEVSLDLLIRWLPRFARTGEDPVAAIVERGRAAKIIRPSTRQVLHLPAVALADYQPLPADLPLTRVPRYARKE